VHRRTLIAGNWTNIHWRYLEWSDQRRLHFEPHFTTLTWRSSELRARFLSTHLKRKQSSPAYVWLQLDWRQGTGEPLVSKSNPAPAWGYPSGRAGLGEVRGICCRRRRFGVSSGTPAVRLAFGATVAAPKAQRRCPADVGTLWNPSSQQSWDLARVSLTTTAPIRLLAFLYKHPAYTRQITRASSLLYSVSQRKQRAAAVIQMLVKLTDRVWQWQQVC